MEARFCKGCLHPIPPERLELLDTDYCVACSDKHTPDRIGFMDWNHKTAPSLVMIPSTDKEGLRRAIRSDRRSR